MKAEGLHLPTRCAMRVGRRNQSVQAGVRWHWGSYSNFWGAVMVCSAARQDAVAFAEMHATNPPHGCLVERRESAANFFQMRYQDLINCCCWKAALQSSLPAGEFLKKQSVALKERNKAPVGFRAAVVDGHECPCAGSPNSGFGFSTTGSLRSACPKGQLSTGNAGIHFG